MIPDKHDDRLFRHYAKLGADGTVLAIVEVAVGADQPAPDTGDVIEVTAIHPYDAPKLRAFVNASPIAAVQRRVQIGKGRG